MRANRTCRTRAAWIGVLLLVTTVSIVACGNGDSNGDSAASSRTGSQRSASDLSPIEQKYCDKWLGAVTELTGFGFETMDEFKLLSPNNEIKEAWDQQTNSEGEEPRVFTLSRELCGGPTYAEYLEAAQASTTSSPSETACKVERRTIETAIAASEASGDPVDELISSELKWFTTPTSSGATRINTDEVSESVCPDVTGN